MVVMAEIVEKQETDRRECLARMLRPMEEESGEGASRPEDTLNEREKCDRALALMMFGL